MRLIILALAPAVALIWLLLSQSRPEAPSKNRMALLFVLGAVAAAVAMTLNHAVEKHTVLWPGAEFQSQRTAFWLLGVGINEEFAKMLVLLLAAYPRPGFGNPWQGLLAAAAVALGFAATENLIYLERYGTLTLLIRSGLTVPAHACFTIPMGVLMALSRQTPQLLGKYLYLLAALVAAATLHGMYDLWFSFESPWLNNLAYLQVLLQALLAWKLVRWSRNLPLVPVVS